jgi:RNA polymerase sigma-70 factor (ECF subfamily)
MIKKFKFIKNILIFCHFLINNSTNLLKGVRIENYRTYSDDELLDLISKDNENYHYAFNEIYLRYSKRLYSYCKYQSRSDEHSQNAFQEAWIALYNNCVNRKKINNISAFLIDVARKRIIDYLRKDYRMPQFTEINDEIIDTMANIEINAIDDFAALIEIGLKNLKKDMREAFIMKRINNLEFSEMSKITGLTIDCLKKRVYRAEEFLKIFLRNNIERD